MLLGGQPLVLPEQNKAGADIHGSHAYFPLQKCTVHYDVIHNLASFKVYRSQTMRKSASCNIYVYIYNHCINIIVITVLTLLLAQSMYKECR